MRSGTTAPSASVNPVCGTPLFSSPERVEMEMVLTKSTAAQELVGHVLGCKCGGGYCMLQPTWRCEFCRGTFTLTYAQVELNPLLFGSTAQSRAPFLKRPVLGTSTTILPVCV